MASQGAILCPLSGTQKMGRWHTEGSWGCSQEKGEGAVMGKEGRREGRERPAGEGLAAVLE